MVDRLGSAIRADHELLVRSRERYDDRFAGPAEGNPEQSAGSSQASWRSIVGDLVTNVGFQQLAAFRVASALDRRRLTPFAMLVSRLIRHLYSAEMHYGATIEPGIVIVHGNGLVVSRAAHIEAGCVLSQHVTIGISAGVSDDGERTSGAPHLGANVHVGPSAVLVGPITIGAGSKVAPNSTVLESIPAATVVSPAPLQQRTRSARVRDEGAVR